MGRKLLWGGFLLLALGPAAGALDDKKETAKEQYDAVLKEYNLKYLEYVKEASAAKTAEERRKAAEKRPNPEAYAGRMLEIAEKNPKDAVAPEALAWVVRMVPTGKTRDQAMALLLKDHVTSPSLGPLCRAIASGRTPGKEETLKTILEKNPHKEVQGQACYWLARSFKEQAEQARRANQPDADRLEKQAEDYFERVVKEFPDVKDLRQSLGELAKAELFELRHLSVGKTAPEIEAEDIDGKKFKLSDYRGKVVLLDFWGHW
jgi:hypothetical protein